MMFENLKQLKILYLGTPEISAEVLSYLLEHGANIIAVVSNEDKPVGRKGILTATPVKAVALAHGIPVFQPAKIRLDHAFLDELDFEIMLTMAYGQILPVEVLNKARVKALNLHGSLLPKYRGAAPIQRAIMNGDKESGVTLMEMVQAMDAGRMYAKKVVSIEEKDNYTSLCKKISNAAGELAIEALLDVANGVNQGIEQNESEVTFAAKILPEEEKLDLEMSVPSLLNAIRGLSLVPGAYLFLDDLKLKVFEAHYVSNEVKGQLGEILGVKKGVFVQGKDGVFCLDQVQLAGKKPMDAASFANGMRDLLGKILR